MFNPQTSPDTGSAISSPASPVGPLQLDLLGGPTTASSGPAAPRASRSPSRVKEKPRMTIGVPGRVGRLRAYGNAIVPEVAAEVIGAYMDCFPEIV